MFLRRFVALALSLAFTTTRCSAQLATSAPEAHATLAAHVLVGYWQDFVNGSVVQPLGDVPSVFDVVEVAFATPDTPVDGGFSFVIDSTMAAAIPGGYTSHQFDADIRKLHGQGRFVLLSIGGKSRSFALTDEGMADRFAASAAKQIAAHGFDGIDIDLESVVTAANVRYLESALRQLRTLVGASLMITLAPQPSDMSPQTPDKANYLKLVKDLGETITMVNTQYYNSGTKKGRDGKVYTDGTVDFITAQADDVLQYVPAERVGIGLPTSPATKGYLTPSLANAALGCLMAGTGCGSYIPTSVYPNLRGAMLWSTNNDATHGAALSQALKVQLAKALVVDKAGRH